MYNYQQPQSNWENQGWAGAPPNSSNSNQNNSAKANNYNSESYSQPKYAQPQPYYAQPYYNQYPTYPVDRYGIPYSPRNWVVMLVLSFFLGWVGADHFYSGHIGTGILKLITGGGFGIWWLIDLILILSGGFADKEGRLVKPY